MVRLLQSGQLRRRHDNPLSSVQTIITYADSLRERTHNESISLPFHVLAMVTIDPTIYVSSSVQDDEVIVFGKSPELEAKDAKEGVSRFGGMWRTPSYTKAYLRAARLLIRSAIETKDLDQLGLPIFYLHRHTLELFIKRLLETLYDIARMRHDLNPTAESNRNLPSRNQLKRLASEHKLIQLHNDLKSISSRLGFDNLPASIEGVVTQIVQYEIEPTWSRYPKPKDPSNKAYLANEVAIPSVEMHAALERAVKEAGYDFEGAEETFETTLHHEWSALNAWLERSGTYATN